MEMAFGKQIHLAANWRQISQDQAVALSRTHSLSFSLSPSLSSFTSFILLWWASSAASVKAHHVRHHLVT